MPAMALPTLATLLHGFFYDWLVEQRNASPATIRAYRDSWRLFLRFAARQKERQVAFLRFEHLTEAEILAFLQHIEQERHGSIITRNCRLAALRSFFAFVAEREPLAARQCAAILHIPFKRHVRRPVCYLEAQELSAILSQTDRTCVGGHRDHVLLLVLYNTGARIQEALSLRPSDLHLDSPAHVRLTGKGRKERIAPLWRETTDALKALLKQQPCPPDQILFTNRYGKPLTASGFRFRLRGYVAKATQLVPTLSRKRITPHVFRHTTAVRLLAAGVDATVIQSWLGHAHLDTTNWYAQANLETKRKALEQADPKLFKGKPPRWKRDGDLLAWLDSL